MLAIYIREKQSNEKYIHREGCTKRMLISIEAR